MGEGKGPTDGGRGDRKKENIKGGVRVVREKGEKRGNRDKKSTFTSFGVLGPDGLGFGGILFEGEGGVIRGFGGVRPGKTKEVHYVFLRFRGTETVFAAILPAGVHYFAGRVGSGFCNVLGVLVGGRGFLLFGGRGGKGQGVDGSQKGGYSLSGEEERKGNTSPSLSSFVGCWRKGEELSWTVTTTTARGPHGAKREIPPSRAKGGKGGETRGEGGQSRESTARRRDSHGISGPHRVFNTCEKQRQGEKRKWGPSVFPGRTNANNQNFFRQQLQPKHNTGHAPKQTRGGLCPVCFFRGGGVWPRAQPGHAGMGFFYHAPTRHRTFAALAGFRPVNDTKQFRFSPRFRAGGAISRNQNLLSETPTSQERSPRGPCFV